MNANFKRLLCICDKKKVLKIFFIAILVSIEKALCRHIFCYLAILRRHREGEIERKSTFENHAYYSNCFHFQHIMGHDFYEIQKSQCTKKHIESKFEEAKKKKKNHQINNNKIFTRRTTRRRWNKTRCTRAHASKKRHRQTSRSLSWMFGYFIFRLSLISAASCLYNTSVLHLAIACIVWQLSLDATILPIVWFVA